MGRLDLPHPQQWGSGKKNVAFLRLSNALTKIVYAVFYIQQMFWGARDGKLWCPPKLADFVSLQYWKERHKFLYVMKLKHRSNLFLKNCIQGTFSKASCLSQHPLITYLNPHSCILKRWNISKIPLRFQGWNTSWHQNNWIFFINAPILIYFTTSGTQCLMYWSNRICASSAICNL